MKQIFNLFLGVSCMLCLFLCQSCVDKDYDWDDVDTKGKIVLPPILIGSFEPIILDEALPEIPPIEGLPDLGFSFAYDHVFEDLFNDDLIDYFFYEGNVVRLIGVADVSVFDKSNKDAKIEMGISFKVLDDEGKEINEIKIPNQINLTEKDNQPIEIKIESEYMKYFESRSARSLKAVIVIKSSSIHLKEDASVSIRNVVMKSNALQFDL